MLLPFAGQPEIAFDGLEGGEIGLQVFGLLLGRGRGLFFDSGKSAAFFGGLQSLGGIRRGDTRVGDRLLTLLQGDDPGGRSFDRCCHRLNTRGDLDQVLRSRIDGLYEFWQTGYVDFQGGALFAEARKFVLQVVQRCQQFVKGGAVVLGSEERVELDFAVGGSLQEVGDQAALRDPHDVGEHRFKIDIGTFQSQVLAQETLGLFGLLGDGPAALGVANLKRRGCDGVVILVAAKPSDYGVVASIDAGLKDDLEAAAAGPLAQQGGLGPGEKAEQSKADDLENRRFASSVSTGDGNQPGAQFNGFVPIALDVFEMDATNQHRGPIRPHRGGRPANQPAGPDRRPVGSAPSMRRRWWPGGRRTRRRR